VNVLIDPPAQENAKVRVLVETWKDTLGGKMVVELFTRISNVFLTTWMMGGGCGW